MKVVISTAVEGEVAIHLQPENDIDRHYIEVLGATQFHAHSLYIETADEVTGITDREDGQVLIGPNGQPPTAIINLFHTQTRDELIESVKTVARFWGTELTQEQAEAEADATIRAR